MSADERHVARIARLESLATRYRAAAIGALLLVFATAQSPAGSPGALVVNGGGGAQAFIGPAGLVVRDSSNTTRVRAALDGNAASSVYLYDTGGRLRQAMYLASDLPVLRQYDPNGKRRGELFQGSTSQNGEFAIRDASETIQLAAFVGSSGRPELALYGSDAKVRAYLATDDDGPYLVMKDGSGQTRAVVGQYTSGKFGMDLRSASDQLLFSAP